MSTRLHDVLEGKEENYILPFFWQHGEEEEVLREEMARIYESGIRAVCVEARPHPDFLGPKWWKDMDVIMEEARSRGMRVWVLDDDHFPTGHAAGRLKDAPKELRRLFLSQLQHDAVGPRKNSSFMVAPPFIPGYMEGGGPIIAVIAIKRDEVTGALLEESFDLTNQVENGKLYWDVPDGYWRIFTIFENDKGGDLEKVDYLNPLVAESVKVLIDTVYESFYERYQNDFGKTLAGFFSDEPGFYSDKSSFITNFDTGLGRPGVDLPWSTLMYSLFENEFGLDYKQFLPLLWHQGGDQTSIIRYNYMNIVSKLYAENFTTQIGNWCREHKVEYIGHVIEDNNVHTRLGCGAGHYFRALGGQDMSGIDVVLWQLNPGFDQIPSRWVVGEADNEFFNYGLAKMATSLAHLDPKKKGRTMAEVFGAYGWVEGLKLMKWMTDHMLVRGVNYFVPHAFSPKEYPDLDCPPHMYARGKNPQYRYYRYLNHYTNRMSHLLSGGTHIASAAVLYHAEAEWSGDYMYFHKPVKELLRNQIDCDILPCDHLLNAVSVHENKLVSQEETFDCLIVPYSEVLPVAVLKRFAELAEQGLPIFFLNSLPQRSSEGELIEGELNSLAAKKWVEVVTLDNLVQRLKDKGYYDIQVKDNEPYLRYYHVRQKESDVFMFFNEHPIHQIETEVLLPVTGTILSYDAYENKTKYIDCANNGSVTQLPIKLAPSETVVIIFGTNFEGIQTEASVVKNGSEIKVEGPWLVGIATSEQYPEFTQWDQLESLSDLSRQEMLPSFSGTFRYETNLNWSKDEGNTPLIDLGEVFETAEVFVNGVSAGVRIAPPYRFDLSGILLNGSNSLAIEVTNTLVKENPDFLSLIAQHEPSGLLGPVRLLCENS